MKTRTLVRRGLSLAAVAALTAGLAACASGASTAATDAAADGESLGTITVGALPVPAGDLLKWVDENLAEEAGLDIEYVEFTDYNTPNPALSDGSTDANLFQNSTFLETYNEQAGGDLISSARSTCPPPRSTARASRASTTSPRATPSRSRTTRRTRAARSACSPPRASSRSRTARPTSTASPTTR